MANIISYIVLFALIALFFLVMRRIMKRDNVINELILGYYDRQTISKDELINRIYEYTCSDYRLNKLINRYQATKDDFSNIFEKLIYWGNFKKRKRYLPINSFFFYGSLSYLLEHKDDDAKKLTQKMMNYFHI